MSQKRLMRARKRLCCPAEPFSSTIISNCQDAAVLLRLHLDLRSQRVAGETKSALQMLRSIFPSDKFLAGFPAIAMRHQLYAMVQNRVEVDKALTEMMDRREVRLFQLGPNETDAAVLFTEDYFIYVRQRSGHSPAVESTAPQESYHYNYETGLLLGVCWKLHKEGRATPRVQVQTGRHCLMGGRITYVMQRKASKVAICWCTIHKSSLHLLRLFLHICYIFDGDISEERAEKFLEKVVMQSQNISYGHTSLATEYSLCDSEISELERLGLLVPRGIGSDGYHWWLGIPGTACFLRTLVRGRTALLQMLRRSKHQELSRVELESRRLPRGTKLGIGYFVYDAIGANLVTCAKTTSGDVLRLRE